MTRARCILRLTTILVLWLASPQPTLAHALLVRSDPPDRAVLQHSPSIIRLWFSEPIFPVRAGLRLTAPSGEAVPIRSFQIQANRLSVWVHLRQEGTYLLHWQVISLDTHPSEGSLAFSLRRVTAPQGLSGTPGELGNVAPLGLILQVTARFTHFVGLALGFGPIYFLLLVLCPLELERAPKVRYRLRHLTSVGIVALLIAEPLSVLGQTASFGDTSVLDPGTITAVMSSPFGRVLGQRLAAAMLLWVFLGIEQERSEVARPLIAILGVVLTVVDGEASHAIIISPRWLGIGANALHLMAMAGWVGGLVTLLVLGHSPTIAAHRAAIVTRFGVLALACLAALALSGAIMAWLDVRDPHALLTTAYGRALAGKTLLLLVALVMPTLARRSVPPETTRWWKFEVALLLGVLGLAGLALALPPAVSLPGT